MRPRKKDRHLPPCVHYRHGAYHYVKDGKWKRLGTDLGPALATYAALFATNSSGGFTSLLNTVIRLKKATVSKGSSRQYKSAAIRLAHVFGNFSPAQIGPREVKRLKREMVDRPVAFNTCLTVLRQTMEYAVDEELIEFNPCAGTKPYRIAKRDRLITQEEYDRIYEHSEATLQCILDLLFLTGQRVVDVLSVQHGDITDEGICFKQAKTGARLVVRWSPDLRLAVNRARTLRANVRAITLFHSRRGKAPDYDTVLAAWKRACTAAGVENAQMRDIRAMSLTAARKQGMDAQALAGHKSAAMTDRYLRDREAPLVDGPSFGQVLDIGQKEAKK